MTTDFVSTDKENVKIKSISGATINTIRGIKNTKEKYDQVIVVVGGNDCAQKGATVKTILEKEQVLLEKVIVSSILPHVNDDEHHLITDHVNEGIKKMCLEIA